MIITKKLLITGALFIGMHHGLYAYDAYTLNTETAQILKFAQVLREVNHTQGLGTAQWLEQQVCDTSCNVSDNDILVMANIVNNPHLTIPSKISALLQIMAAQKAEEKRINKLSTLNTLGNAIIAAAFLGCFTTIIALSIMEEMANPTKKIWLRVDEPCAKNRFHRHQTSYSCNH